MSFLTYCDNNVVPRLIDIKLISNYIIHYYNANSCLTDIFLKAFLQQLNIFINGKQT